MICTRCQGTGFLNIHQLPDELQIIGFLNGFETDNWHEYVLMWINNNDNHDVSVCDCCGDGEYWYGNIGEHSASDYGRNGVYAYNGGLPECY